MAVETTKWGVLYCPKKTLAGSRRHREKIQRALNASGIDYDFVQSENMNSVERLATMLINNGYKTIIVVGGDGALNDVLN